MTVDALPRVPAAAAVPELAASIQFSLVAAESLLYARGRTGKVAHDHARAFLEWIASVVPDDTQDAELAGIRTRALYLARAALALGADGGTVPYLRYSAYQGLVQSLLAKATAISDEVRSYQDKIEHRKTQELQARGLKQINENIKQSGRLLSDYVAAMAAHQKDVADYQRGIVDQRRKEYEKSILDVGKLQSQLDAQHQAVKDAVEDFKAAVRDWETRQWISFALTAVTNAFAVGTTIMVPAGEISAVKTLCTTAQRIQKIINLLNALAKVEGDAEKTIKDLGKVNKALANAEQLQLPSDKEWDEFKINFGASLAEVPAELGGAKAKLQAAVDILVLRGRAWVDARAKQASLRQEIDQASVLDHLNAKQSDRLQRLRTNLRLDDTDAPPAEGIDLIALTGAAQYQLKQTLLALARVLMLQDASIRYEYLGEPTEITSFTLRDVLNTMILQQQAILTGQSNLDPPPAKIKDPISYRVAHVPVSELRGGGFRFRIPLDAAPFYGHAMVRVDRVQVRIDGVTGSDTGRYLATLAFEGMPFHDRDKQRQDIAFDTVQRHFGPYEYTIDGHQAQFGSDTGATPAAVTRVTPFGAWLVGLPNTETNKNVKFAGDTVDVVLTFDVTTLRIDPPAQFGAFYSSGSGQQAMDLDGVTTEMNKAGSALRGWDAVFSMDLTKVNQVLQAIYREKNPGGGSTISFGAYGDPVPVNDDYIAPCKKMDITVDAPTLTFAHNNSGVASLTQLVTSGTVTNGSKKVPQDWTPPAVFDPDDPAIQWGHPKSVDIKKDPAPRITATVPLSKVHGLVSPKTPGAATYSVVLDLAKGTFQANNIHSQTQDTHIDDAVTSYFVNREVQYLINTIDCSDLTTIKGLQPTSFGIATKQDNAGRQILQLFITTSGEARPDSSITVGEPIPRGYDCSLMINSRILFDDILVGGFNSAGTGLTAKASDPGNLNAAWSTDISGNVAVNVPFKVWRDSSWFVPGGKYIFQIDASGNTAHIDIGGLKLCGSADGRLQIQLDKKGQEQPFVYKTCAFIPRQGEMCDDNWWNAKVTYDLKASGAYEITVTDAPNQQIKIANPDATPTVIVPRLEPSGACSMTNTNDIKNKVGEPLKDAMPGAVGAAIKKVAFQQASVFALENILFPAGQHLTLSQARVPGDLLIVGTMSA